MNLIILGILHRILSLTANEFIRVAAEERRNEGE